MRTEFAVQAPIVATQCDIWHDVGADLCSCVRGNTARMNCLHSAFAKSHSALVTFTNLCGRGDKNIFTVSDVLGVEL